MDFTPTTQNAAPGVLLAARQEASFKDPHRPAYHFLPPANWMNDPNGLIYWNKQYHLFYQYNPNGPVWGTIHWGHAVSDDLIHWRDLPLALTPSPHSPDSDGCWSGCAVDNDGVPTLVYTGVRGDLQLPCLATSRDNLHSWEKYEDNPVLAGLPSDLDLLAFRDPAVWREGADWYMVVGAGLREGGGAALLFHSTNLTEWTYLQPLLKGDINQTEPVWTGSVWECPQLIPLGAKQLLSFGVCHEQPLYTVGILGTYANGQFSPESEFKLDYGNEYFYAPQTLIEPNGRAIMWGWIAEGRSELEQRAAGWAGVMSLPRILSLSYDNTLKQVPAPELSALRRIKHQFDGLYLEPNVQNRLSEVQGDCLEIIVELVPDEQSIVVIAVLCSPDGQEQTLISYDQERQWLEIDNTSSSIAATPKQPRHGGFLPLARGSTLRLHVFVDRSVIEIFANERVCLTGRAYPERADSLGISLGLKSQLGIEVKTLEVWELSSIWY